MSLSYSDLFYLLIVGVEGCCCSLTHSITHTHTHDRTPLEEGSARCRYHYMKTHSTHNREIFMFPGGIQTRNPSKRAAAELCLRPRGHWDRPIIYIICVIRMIKSRRMRWMEVEKLNYITLP